MNSTSLPSTVPTKLIRVDQPHIPPPRWFQACFSSNGTLLIMSNSIHGIQPLRMINTNIIPSTTTTTTSTSNSLGNTIVPSNSISSSTTSNSSSIGFGYSFKQSPVSIYNNPEINKILLPYPRHYEELLFRLSLVGRYHYQYIMQQQYQQLQPSKSSEYNRTQYEAHDQPVSKVSRNTNKQLSKKHKRKQKQSKLNNNTKENTKYNDNDIDIDNHSIASSISDVSSTESIHTEMTTSSTVSSSSSLCSSSISNISNTLSNSINESELKAINRTNMHRLSSDFSLSSDNDNQSIISSSNENNDDNAQEFNNTALYSQIQPSTSINNLSRNIITNTNEYSMIASDVHEVTNDIQSLFPPSSSANTIVYTKDKPIIPLHDDYDNESLISTNKPPIEFPSNILDGGYNTTQKSMGDIQAKEIYSYDTITSDSTENTMLALVNRPGLGLQHGIVTIALIEGQSGLFDEYLLFNHQQEIFMKNQNTYLPYNTKSMDHEIETNTNNERDIFYQRFMYLYKQRIEQLHGNKDNMDDNNGSGLDNIDYDIESLWSILSIANEQIPNSDIFSSNTKNTNIFWNPIMYHIFHYWLHNNYIHDAIQIQELYKYNYIQHQYNTNKNRYQPFNNDHYPLFLSAFTSLYSTELHRQYAIVPAIDSKKGILFTYNNDNTTLEINYNDRQNQEIIKNDNTADSIVESKVDASIESVNNESSSTSVICSLCTLPVKGLSIQCCVCGHGGHEHIYDWFQNNNECSTGCGCYCII